MAEIKNKIIEEIEHLQKFHDALADVVRLGNSLIILSHLEIVKRWSWDELAKRENLIVNQEASDSDVPF